MPIRSRGKIFNDCNYAAMFPVVAPEDMQAQGEKAEAALGAAMASMRERWEGEWLLEIIQKLAFWDACDLSALPPEEMLAHYDATMEKARRLWQMHFEIVDPVYAAIGLFDNLYKDLFDEQGAFSALQLLGGFDNKPHEIDCALWDLRQKATDAEVRQVLSTKAIGEVVAALECSAPGEVFLGALSAWPLWPKNARRALRKPASYWPAIRNRCAVNSSFCYKRRKWGWCSLKITVFRSISSRCIACGW